MKEVMKLLQPINASRLRVLPNFDGGDNENWVSHGVPGGNLDTQNEKYFYFHHTEGMNVVAMYYLDQLLLNHDIHCLCKLCKSRSIRF